MALYTNIKGPINYTTVGSPTIENGIVSNISNSNYIKTEHFIVQNNDTFEWCVKFKINTLVGNKAIVGGNCKMVPLTNANGKITYYATAETGESIFSGQTGSHTLSTNQFYYLKFVYNGSNYTAYLSTDKINWEIDITKTTSLKVRVDNDYAFCFGYNQTASQNFSNGEIDLKESYISRNDIAWFGTSFSRVKLHSPTAISYTVKGNPTITEDGVASGFTDKTDYLTLGAFNPGTNKWKFTTKVKIYDYATQISLIDRNSSTRCFQIVVRTTGKFRVNISTNGSSKANEVDGTHVVSVNTIYYICFEYDGSKYYLKYSLDNINWVTDITINNSTKIYPVSSMCMGHSWYNSGTEKWNGEIYLRYTRFEINGVTNDKYKLHCLEGN